MPVHCLQHWSNNNTTSGDGLVVTGWSSGTEEMGCIETYTCVRMHCKHSVTPTQQKGDSALDTDMRRRVPLTITYLQRWHNLQTALVEHCWCRPTQLYTYTP